MKIDLIIEAIVPYLPTIFSALLAAFATAFYKSVSKITNKLNTVRTETYDKVSTATRSIELFKNDLVKEYNSIRADVSVLTSDLHDTLDFIENNHSEIAEQRKLIMELKKEIVELKALTRKED